MKNVAAISGRKRIFRRAGLRAKRIDVNLTTFAPHRKKKMHPEKDSSGACRRRAWSGWERVFRKRKM
jgi:hypothetical protein